MNDLPIFQAIAYVFIALFGIIGNVGTIYILKLTKSLGENNGIDRTTLNLIVESCLCDLILNCVTLPLRVWNIFAGKSWLFDDYSIGCWIHATTLQSFYVTAWLQFGIAATRGVAVFRPQKYKIWLRLQAVRWLLYVVPWILGFSTHILYSFVLRSFKPSTDPMIGGLCVVSPVAIDMRAPRTYNYILFNIILQLALPLLLSAAVYLTIFMKLLLIGIRRRTGPSLVTTATTPTGPAGVVSASKVAWAGSIAVSARSNTAAKRNNCGKVEMEVQNQSSPTTATTHASRKRKRRETERLNETRRLRSVKVLALVSLLIFCCVAPRPIFGFQLAARTPGVVVLLEAILFLSTCVGPVVYAITLTDVRASWRKLLRKVWMRA